MWVKREMKVILRMRYDELELERVGQRKIKSFVLNMVSLPNSNKIEAR